MSTEPSPEQVDPTVVNEPDASRYAVSIDGRVVGFAAYRLLPGRVVFVHTEIDGDVEGRGVGSRLARAALDDVIGRGLQITPLCPFIAGYVSRHPGYVQHVDPGHRARFSVT